VLLTVPGRPVGRRRGGGGALACGDLFSLVVVFLAVAPALFAWVNGRDYFT
jgi:hypothetical protein